MEIQDQLYEKMSGEYTAFLDGLKRKPPGEIIGSAYEKVFKEDILLCVEMRYLLPDEAEALFALDNPLEELYQAWLDSDLSYMELLEDCIDERAAKAIEQMEAALPPAKAEKPSVIEQLRAAQEKAAMQEAAAPERRHSRGEPSI